VCKWKCFFDFAGISNVCIAQEVYRRLNPPFKLRRKHFAALCHTLHPGARPTNGLVPKMGRFLWQELDEVGDFGRFPVKKRDILDLLDERASSARFSHATARRPGPRRADTRVIDCGGHRERSPDASFCALLAFPARDRRNVRHCGRNARNLAPGSRPQ